ncbi:MAG: DUF2442 domain-containing protein [Bacteroidales bacterium]|nr:DUF2442 domain-containing protein [Bacteroidales bacterium]
MSTKRNKIINVWTDDVRVYARTEDGSVASYAFDQWERLKNATKEQRDNFSLSFSGIHWPQLDEDLSFTGMFINSGLCSPSTPEEAYYYE